MKERQREWKGGIERERERACTINVVNLIAASMGARGNCHRGGL